MPCTLPASEDGIQYELFGNGQGENAGRNQALYHVADGASSADAPRPLVISLTRGRAKGSAGTGTGTGTTAARVTSERQLADNEKVYGEVRAAALLPRLRARWCRGVPGCRLTQ